MNMIGKTLFAAALMTCTAGVFAAPTGEMRQHPHQKDCPQMMVPPPASPVYAVIQQTDSPNDTLNSAIKNVPTLEQGKRYEVRVEVRELPPIPQKAPTPNP